jgi:transcription-repair coupling factor (superfamily II helicase)
MALQQLVDHISEFSQELVSAIRSGERIPALGLPRAARLPLVAALYHELNVPLILLTDRSDRALLLSSEMELWAPQANRMFFPEPNPLFYEKAPWGENIRRERLSVLTNLASYHIPGGKQASPAPLIIAPARAFMCRTLPRREFLKHTRSIKVGQTLPVGESLANWHKLGYERVNTVIAPGQYARRGGILDLWSAALPQPIRIELFGDIIETLRPFDPRTQRTLKLTEKLYSERYLIGPAREVILSGGQNNDRVLDEDALAEFYLASYQPTAAIVLDYLPEKSLVVIEDKESIQDTILDIEEQAVRMRQDAIQNGSLSEDFPIPYVGWTEIEDHLENCQTLILGPLINDNEKDDRYNFNLATHFSPNPRYGGRLKIFIEHLAELVTRRELVWVVSRQKSRLEELWKETQARRSAMQKTNVGNRRSTRANLTEVEFLSGSLSEGWSLRSNAGASCHLFSDGEIFGFRPPEQRLRRRINAEDPEAAYADLQAGDYVVHIDHGIGIFVGLVSRTIEGNPREFLCIEYADEAQLFVPVYQADRLTRYVGPDGRNPSLSRLGGLEWKSVKSYVKEAVQQVAEDLLELYAKRSISQGHAFAKDSAWQQELEASFPYIETEDQTHVLEEVKKDMEKSDPMDRLICGDVGYGKTEVALRAAFKCVMDGKQVAMLVPTTILAQQHFNTFNQRLSAFPVTVEMLSRFRTPQQQRQILRQLKVGAIDIIIGTHRLLSLDVELKDLGLLIIDEEQRFGVTHKERLKQMRTEVDVLTLTATPIPRTLYMALSGVRDISTINTPPEERLPVITHVGAYAASLVRRAILRELERGGQVFFVHNRVQTINAMRAHLEKLVPEARITVAHGQMAENELSDRMKQFTNGEIDVLLSTSIIESGLDIPNANTLIVDRADTFGLAQLYQLRGRVGRGAQRAYAYFFRHTRKLPTLEGRQRMETIAENTQLGSGFSIAMRDLEIRGTGDILGTRQSGHVAAVGFYLYTRLLAEVVHRLRKSSPLASDDHLEANIDESYLPINVDLPLPVSIPADYVPEKNMRLRLYRRLANIKSPVELEAMEEEFRDRFGDLPEALTNILYQLKIKLLAENAGLASISAENGQLVLKYPDGNTLPSLPGLDAHIRVGKTSLWLPYASLDNWREILEDSLRELNLAQPKIKIASN